MPARRVISTVVSDPRPSPRTISMTASMRRRRVEGVPAAFRSARTFRVELLDMIRRGLYIFGNEHEPRRRGDAALRARARERESVGPDRRVRDGRRTVFAPRNAPVAVHAIPADARPEG